MEEYNPQEVAEKIMEALQKARKNMKNLNIMVMGKTGVGKSTLINNVFNEPLAETGIGKPITQQIRKYNKPDFPVSIYDTPGLELGGSNSMEELRKEAISVVFDGVKTGDINNAIHCIWYCVSTPSKRFEEAEKEFINLFLNETKEYNVPVIMILSQSFSKKDAKNLKEEIEKENLNVAQIIPLLASDYEIDEDYIAKAYGLDRLVEITSDVIPEAIRKTLEAVQKVSIDIKVKRGHTIVASSSAAAAAAGAVPIPFSDAAILIPGQIAMLSGITAAFGLPIAKSTITAIVSATLGTAGTTVLGKTVVSGLFKLIPGVGSLVGAAISGSMAAALTFALGEAYIHVLVLIARGEIKASDLETKKGKEMMSNLFKDKLKLKRNKNGKVEK